MSRFFKILFGLIIIIIFVVWQYFFIKNTFGIDLLARNILPDGFCKDCNVILISLDTLRAKSLPCYGYEKNTAPNLCEFTSKSYLFKNSFSTSSKTLDSHFSIFTSLYPSSHQMNIPFVSNLSEEIKTLTQVLKENDYKTLYSGPQSDPHLPLKRGLERGFDVTFNAADPDDWIKNLKEFNPAENKFFAFLHTYEVHEPYIPEKENISKFYASDIKEHVSWDQLSKKICIDINEASYDYCNNFSSSAEFGKCYQEQFDKYYESKMKSYWDAFKDMDNTVKKEFVQALYETKIYELDQKLARFFKFLREKNLLSKSIVVITADHGEEFNEHGGWTHAEKLYTESIKVPLIIYVPKSEPQVTDKLVSSIDIMPSILSLVGIEVSHDVTGINIFSKNNNDFVIAQHVTTNLTSIITSKYQLIINNSKKELYNLIEDPNEQNNLITKYGNVAQDLDIKLGNYLNKLPEYNFSNLEPFPTWIDKNQRKKLIETGYF